MFCVFCLFTDASTAFRPFTEGLQLSYGLTIGFCSVKASHNPVLLWPYTTLLCAPFIPLTPAVDCLVATSPAQSESVIQAMVQGLHGMSA